MITLSRCLRLTLLKAARFTLSRHLSKSSTRFTLLNTQCTASLAINPCSFSSINLVTNVQNTCMELSQWNELWYQYNNDATSILFSSKYCSFEIYFCVCLTRCVSICTDCNCSCFCAHSVCFASSDT
eukprot:961675_1